MEDNVKKILYKQLELLAERSKFKNISVNELTQLNKEIVNLAQVLLEVQNQSFYGASTNHPYVVQLPVGDLLDLYAARAQRFHQSSESHRR